MREPGERYYEQPGWRPYLVRFADENADWLERIAVTNDSCAICGKSIGWLTDENGRRYATQDYVMADEDAELVACPTCWEKNGWTST